MREIAALAVLALMAASSPAAAKAGLIGCDAFLDKLRMDAADLQVDFTHAVVVSRTKTDQQVFDITTKSEVDGTLTCKGDVMLRFEAHVAEPASARANTGFERLASAAQHAALGWEAAKAKSTLKSMSADAHEYFAASRQRGDVYVAGKTEEHAPGGVSLGFIITDVDRAFVIVNGE